MGRFENCEWDDTKDTANLAKHGLPLIAAIPIFADPDWVERPSAQLRASESRFVAIGQVRGRLLACVYVWRGATRRIISLRTASRKERRVYQEEKK
jgi:uncharacterized DUF497 family protein